jgi:hypothetical protein
VTGTKELLTLFSLLDYHKVCHPMAILFRTVLLLKGGNLDFGGLLDDESYPQNLWIDQVIHALTVTKEWVIHALTVTTSRINGHHTIYSIYLYLKHL